MTPAEPMVETATQILGILLVEKGNSKRQMGRCRQNVPGSRLGSLLGLARGRPAEVSRDRVLPRAPRSSARQDPCPLLRQPKLANRMLSSDGTPSAVDAGG